MVILGSISSRWHLSMLWKTLVVFQCLNSQVALGQNRIAACLQPVDFGNCAMTVVRYFYDPKLDTCRVFIYGGCDGNDNRFDTREQCTRICNAGPEQPRNDQPQNFPTFNDNTASGVCSLPADPGTCTDTNLIQYYYDTVTDSCRLFVYGGCGGNSNRFRTKLTCQVACGGVNDEGTTAAVPQTTPAFVSRITRSTTPAPFVTRTTTRAPPPTNNLCYQPNRQQALRAFNYRSSFLHIFPNIPITCPGVVRSWQFIPRIAVADGVYLAVFRARVPSTNATAYTLVGMTPIFNYRVRVNVWNDYQVPAGREFNVLSGDVLGIFYENWDVTDDISVIGLADIYSPDYEALRPTPNLLAHVQQRGREQVVFDMNLQGFIDASLSVRTFRYPAMRIGIDTNARAPAPSPSTTRRPRIDYYDTDFTDPPIIVTRTTQNPGNNPACLDEFQTSQTCLDNALRRGVDSRVFKARWFFDITVRMCAMFWYVPDCYRSQNLFDTEFECRATCSGYMATTTPRDFK